ncbi:MAG: alternative oxidase [Acidimicrobiales bacterium]
MSVLEARAPFVADPARPPGPPKLSPAELARAQRETLAVPRLRRDPFTTVLVAMVDLVYGRRGSLGKFKVLELLAPLPYQAWERAAYRALTRLHSHTTVARRVFDAMVEARAQQDNEAFHLLVLEELLQDQGAKQGFLRYRLLPRLMAAPYRLLCWALFLVRPAWSYRLNASFEDHAEHAYMSFVAAHPELEAEPFRSEAASDYGRYESVADVLRQIGHDERIHKLESLSAQHRPQLS